MVLGRASRGAGESVPGAGSGPIGGPPEIQSLAGLQKRALEASFDGEMDDFPQKLLQGLFRGGIVGGVFGRSLGGILGVFGWSLGVLLGVFGGLWGYF